MDEPMPGSLADTAHQPMPAVEPFPLTPKVMGSPFDSERQAPALHLALGSHSGTEDSSPRRCPSPWGEALRDRGMCSSTIVSPHRAAPSASSSGRRHSADAASQKDGHSHVGGRRSPWTKSVFPSRNAFDFDLDDAPPLFRHALQKMVVHPEAPSSPEAHPSEELEQAAAPPVAVGPSAATPPPSPAPLEHTNNIDPHPSPAEITLPESILLPSHIGTPNGPPSHSPSHSGQGNEAFALPNSTAPLSSSSSRNTVSTTRSHPSFTVSSASRGSLRAPIRSHPTFVSQSQSSDGAGVAVCPSGTAMPLARTAGSPTIHTIPSDRSPPSVPNFVTLDGSESGLLAAVHMATFRSGDHNNSRGRMYRCLEVEEASDPLSQVASTPVAEIALPETHDNAAAAVGGWSCPYTIVRQRRGRSTGSSSGGSSGLFQSGIVERSGENTGDHCGHPDAANDFSNGLDSSCPGEEENGGGCGRAMPLVISTSAAGEGCSSSGSGTQVSPHTSPFTRHRRSKLGANGSIGARVSTTRVSAISSSWQQPSSSASQTRIATSEHLNVNGKTRKNGSHSALSGMAGHHHHNGWSRTFASSSTQHHAALNHHVNPCAGSSDGGGVEGDEGNFFSNSSLSMSSTLRSLTPGNIPLHHSHHGASPLFGRFGNAPPPSMLQHLGLSHSSSHSHLGNFGNSRSELYLASLHQQQLLRGGLVQALAQSSTSVTAMDTSDVGWYVQSTTTSPSLASALLEPPLDAGASSSTQISFSLAPTWEIEEREGGVSGLGGGGGNSIMSASALSTTSGGSPACILFPPRLSSAGGGTAARPPGWCY